MTIDRVCADCLCGSIIKYRRKTADDFFFIDWAWSAGEIWFTLGMNLDADVDYSEIEFDSASDMLVDLKKKVNLLGVLNIIDHWDTDSESCSDEEYKVMTNRLLTALLNNDTRYIRNFIQEHKV